MFFTPGSSCTPRCTAWATIFQPTLTLTLVPSAPAMPRTAATSALRSAGAWLFAG